MARLAEKTGYPEEMLDPELDLEADMGIDTVKQLAVMSETRAHFGLEIDPSFKLRDHNTIARFVAYLAARLGGVGAVVTSPREPVAADGPVTTTRETHDPFAEVRAALLARLVERTGYPEDMLDLDLDLEADLGIDTVKQLAVMSETRAFFGLEIDQSFKLRDHNTIRKFVDYLARRIAPKGGGASNNGHGAGSGSHNGSHNGNGALVSAARRNGSSVARPRTAAATDEAKLEAAACLRLLLTGAGGRLAERFRVEDLAFMLPAGREVTIDDSGDGLVRLVSPAGVHAQARFRDDVSAIEPPALRPEVRAALDRRGRQHNGAELARDLGVGDDGAQLTWIAATAFDEVAAAIRLPERVETPASAAALVLNGAFFVAAAGWHALGGTTFTLAGFDVARFFRLPRAGEELLVHARLRAPLSSRWRADLFLVDPSMNICAHVEGVLGSPIAMARAVDGGDDGAALRWQHVVRRMLGPIAEGEDHSW